MGSVIVENNKMISGFTGKVIVFGRFDAENLPDVGISSCYFVLPRSATSNWRRTSQSCSLPWHNPQIPGDCCETVHIIRKIIDSCGHFSGTLKVNCDFGIFALVRSAALVRSCLIQQRKSKRKSK